MRARARGDGGAEPTQQGEEKREQQQQQRRGVLLVRVLEGTALASGAVGTAGDGRDAASAGAGDAFLPFSLHAQEEPRFRWDAGRKIRVLGSDSPPGLDAAAQPQRRPYPGGEVLWDKVFVEVMLSEAAGRHYSRMRTRAVDVPVGQDDAVLFDECFKFENVQQRQQETELDEAAPLLSAEVLHGHTRREEDGEEEEEDEICISCFVQRCFLGRGGSPGTQVLSRLVGSCCIPISRLGQNVPVAQYYQLIPPDENVATCRAVVKLELLHETQSLQNDGGDAISEDALAREHELANRALGPGSGTDPALHIDTAAASADGATLEGGDNVHTKAAVDADADATPAGKYDDSVQGEEEKQSEMLDAERVKLELDILPQYVRDMPVPVGLVDYVVIAGAHADELPYLVQDARDRVAAAAGDSGQQQGGVAVAAPRPPIEDEENTSAVLWRYPEEDHDELELPARLEWFCLPDGVQCVISEQAPAPRFRSFIMQHADARIYGASVQFHLPYPDDAFLPPDANALDGSVPEVCWFPLSLCFLTRLPEFRMWDLCLADALVAVLEQSGWLTERLSDPTDEDGAKAADAETPSSPYSAVTGSFANWPLVHKRDAATRRHFYMQCDHWPDGVVWYPPLQFSVDFVSNLAQLCFEAPLPVPGVLSVSFDFLSREHHCHIPHPSQFPWSPFDAWTELANRFPPADLVRLFECLLGEGKVLFIGKDFGTLVPAAESLLSLMYPLHWEHVYVPLLPRHLLYLLQAPLPFIVGIHADWIHDVSPEYLADVTIADVDAGAVAVSCTFAEKATAMPPSIEHFLVHRLSALRDANQLELTDTIGVTCGELVRLAFLVAMAELLKSLPPCIFFLDEHTPFVNRQLFLQELANSADRFHREKQRQQQRRSTAAGAAGHPSEPGVDSQATAAASAHRDGDMFVPCPLLTFFAPPVEERENRRWSVTDPPPAHVHIADLHMSSQRSASPPAGASESNTSHYDDEYDDNNSNNNNSNHNNNNRSSSSKSTDHTVRCNRLTRKNSLLSSVLLSSHLRVQEHDSTDDDATDESEKPSHFRGTRASAAAELEDDAMQRFRFMNRLVDSQSFHFMLENITDPAFQPFFFCASTMRDAMWHQPAWDRAAEDDEDDDKDDDGASESKVPAPGRWRTLIGSIFASEHDCIITRQLLPLVRVDHDMSQRHCFHLPVRQALAVPAESSAEDKIAVRAALETKDTLDSPQQAAGAATKADPRSLLAAEDTTIGAARGAESAQPSNALPHGDTAMADGMTQGTAADPTADPSVGGGSASAGKRPFSAKHLRVDTATGPAVGFGTSKPDQATAPGRLRGESNDSTSGTATAEATTGLTDSPRALRKSSESTQQQSGDLVRSKTPPPPGTGTGTGSGTGTGATGAGVVPVVRVRFAHVTSPVLSLSKSMVTPVMTRKTSSPTSPVLSPAAPSGNVPCAAGAAVAGGSPVLPAEGCGGRERLNSTSSGGSVAGTAVGSSAVETDITPGTAFAALPRTSGALQRAQPSAHAPLGEFDIMRRLQQDQGGQPQQQLQQQQHQLHPPSAGPQDIAGTSIIHYHQPAGVDVSGHHIPSAAGGIGSVHAAAAASGAVLVPQPGQVVVASPSGSGGGYGPGAGGRTTAHGSAGGGVGVRAGAGVAGSGKAITQASSLDTGVMAWLARGATSSSDSFMFRSPRTNPMDPTTGKVHGYFPNPHDTSPQTRTSAGGTEQTVTVDSLDSLNEHDGSQPLSPHVHFASTHSSHSPPQQPPLRSPSQSYPASHAHSQGISPTAAGRYRSRRNSSRSSMGDSVGAASFSALASAAAVTPPCRSRKLTSVIRREQTLPASFDSLGASPRSPDSASSGSGNIKHNIRPQSAGIGDDEAVPASRRTSASSGAAVVLGTQSRQSTESTATGADSSAVAPGATTNGSTPVPFRADPQALATDLDMEVELRTWTLGDVSQQTLVSAIQLHREICGAEADAALVALAEAAAGALSADDESIQSPLLRVTRLPSVQETLQTHMTEWQGMEALCPDASGLDDDDESVHDNSDEEDEGEDEEERAVHSPGRSLDKDPQRSRLLQQPAKPTANGAESSLSALDIKLPPDIRAREGGEEEEQVCHVQAGPRSLHLMVSYGSDGSDGSDQSEEEVHSFDENASSDGDSVSGSKEHPKLTTEALRERGRRSLLTDKGGSGSSVSDGELFSPQRGRGPSASHGDLLQDAQAEKTDANEDRDGTGRAGAHEATTAAAAVGSVETPGGRMVAFSPGSLAKISSSRSLDHVPIAPVSMSPGPDARKAMNKALSRRKSARSMAVNSRVAVGLAGLRSAPGAPESMPSMSPHTDTSDSQGQGSSSGAASSELRHSGASPNTNGTSGEERGGGCTDRRTPGASSAATESRTGEPAGTTTIAPATTSRPTADRRLHFLESAESCDIVGDLSSTRTVDGVTRTMELPGSAPAGSAAGSEGGGGTPGRGHTPVHGSTASGGGGGSGTLLLNASATLGTITAVAVATTTRALENAVWAGGYLRQMSQSAWASAGGTNVAMGSSNQSEQQGRGRAVRQNDAEEAAMMQSLMEKQQASSATAALSAIELGAHRVRFAFAMAMSLSMNRLPKASLNLLHGCADALKQHEVRMELVRLMRQSRRRLLLGADLGCLLDRKLPSASASFLQSSSITVSEAAMQRLPVHGIAFEVLCELCFVALQACASANDFRNALRILKFAAQYYHVVRAFPCGQHSTGLPSSRTEKGAASAGSAYCDICLFVHPREKRRVEIETLQERVRQHPIFQNVRVWHALLRTMLAHDRKVVHASALRRPSILRAANYKDGELAPPAIDRVEAVCREMAKAGLNRDRVERFVRDCSRRKRAPAHDLERMHSHVLPHLVYVGDLSGQQHQKKLPSPSPVPGRSQSDDKATLLRRLRGETVEEPFVLHYSSTDRATLEQQRRTPPPPDTLESGRDGGAPEGKAHWAVPMALERPVGEGSGEPNQHSIAVPSDDEPIRMLGELTPVRSVRVPSRTLPMSDSGLFKLSGGSDGTTEAEGSQLLRRWHRPGWRGWVQFLGPVEQLQLHEQPQRVRVNSSATVARARLPAPPSVSSEYGEGDNALPPSPPPPPAPAPSATRPPRSIFRSPSGEQLAWDGTELSQLGLASPLPGEHHVVAAASGAGMEEADAAQAHCFGYRQSLGSTASVARFGAQLTAADYQDGMATLGFADGTVRVLYAGPLQYDGTFDEPYVHWKKHSGAVTTTKHVAGMCLTTGADGMVRVAEVPDWPPGGGPEPGVLDSGNVSAASSAHASPGSGSDTGGPRDVLSRSPVVSPSLTLSPGAMAMHATLTNQGGAAGSGRASQRLVQPAGRFATLRMKQRVLVPDSGIPITTANLTTIVTAASGYEKRQALYAVGDARGVCRLWWLRPAPRDADWDRKVVSGGTYIVSTAHVESPRGARSSQQSGVSSASDALSTIALNATHGRLAVGSQSGVLATFDVQQGAGGRNAGATSYLAPPFTCRVHKSGITMLEWGHCHPHVLFTASRDRSVRVWDLRTGPQATSNGPILRSAHTAAVTSFAVGGTDDRLVVTGCADGVVRLWDMRHDHTQPCARLVGHTDLVTGVEWNGSALLRSCAEDGNVREWNVSSGICLYNIAGHNAGVSFMRSSVHGMVTAAADGSCVFWRGMS